MSSILNCFKRKSKPLKPKPITDVKEEYEAHARAKHPTMVSFDLESTKGMAKALDRALASEKKTLKRTD